MGWTYRCEYVKCGKGTCKSCPHGPYWYGYMHIAGKVIKRYFGKIRPSWAGPVSDRKLAQDDAIFNDRTATVAIALRIMGLVDGYTAKDLRDRYRQLALELHPDRGGDKHRMQQVNAAYSFLSAQRTMF